MKMQFFKVARPIYIFLRSGLAAAGLFKPLRSLVGPHAGRIMSRLTANPSRPTMILGHKMILASGSGYPPVAMAMDRYEKETTELFTDLVKPGMAVIDVGAHVGYYSLLAARLVGSTGRVYSFEPEPSNHELLLGNIDRNEYRNIMAVRKAVSSSVGSTTLFLTALDNGRHSAYQHELPGRGITEVETTTIDAFLEDEGWPKIDLVKVDVEGAEKDVLRGMGLLLEKSPSLILIMEFSPILLQGAAVNPLEFLDLVANQEFEVRSIAGNSGAIPFPKDDWPNLVSKLVQTQCSVNLLCTRN